MLRVHAFAGELRVSDQTGVTVQRAGRGSAGDATTTSPAVTNVPLHAVAGGGRDSDPRGRIPGDVRLMSARDAQEHVRPTQL
ncbi:hypothetical protein GN956_G22993 [Arapaima gigas]